MAPKITLTEQRLCKIWARARTLDDWWNTWQECTDIAELMSSQSCNDAAELFTDAAQAALDNAIHTMRLERDALIIKPTPAANVTNLKEEVTA
ncbi:MAG: hypothetical protein Q8S73_34225 [Deltaproteobacteria bacterium]|nr:hypothetical protein [Deltaproteobacteria bacterium]